jgi:hypothetical protein
VMNTLFGNENYSYYGGTSPRSQVVEGVYTSTNMPFFMTIPMHSEMAYRENFPYYIGFYCEKAPLIGGETPIADNREIYREINPELRDKIEKHGITYYRKLKKMTPFLRFLNRFNPMIQMASWDYLFKTSEKTDVEKYCREQGYSFKWNQDTLIIQTTIPATVVAHGTPVWMNSAHFFQVHHRIWGRIPTFFTKLLLKLTNSPNLSATLGNGTPLTSKEVSGLVDAYEKYKVQFKWKAGDITILNNYLFSHGRSPYLGTRKIRVSLKKNMNYTGVDI